MSEGVRVLTSGIEGIDIVLGGGLRLVERVPGAGESATLLVRGAAGTGKTLLAMHLAAAVANALSADVAVACVEILPSELQAQLAGFATTRALGPVLVGDGVAPGSSPRLFARVVEAKPERTEDPLGDAVVRLLEWVERCGGDPRVLVVDSLSDGYGLGGKIARPAADALAKLAAQRGLCLVLVEEVTRLVPTPWCFAVDTVIELRLDGFEGRSRQDRSLSVTKNRFGPSDAGPHELAIGDARITVLPDPEAWDRALAGGWWKLPVQAKEGNDSWGEKEFEGHAKAQRLIPFSRSTTYVLADTPGAASLCSTHLIGVHGQHLLSIPLRGDAAESFKTTSSPATSSAHRIIAMMIACMKSRLDPVSVVALGDFSVIHGLPNEGELRRAVARLVAWLRGVRIASVLIETTSPRLLSRTIGLDDQMRTVELNASWQPGGVAGENVRVEVVSGSVIRTVDGGYTEPPRLVLGPCVGARAGEVGRELLGG